MATTPLITDDLVAVLALIGDADSVELKLTVPESAQRSTTRRWRWTRSRPRSARCSSSTPRTWP